MSTNPRDVLREIDLRKEQQKAEKLRHYRSKRRRIIFCFLVCAALMFIFGMMWVDVYDSQMDIPSEMRTSRQDWAQWPIIPAFLFGVFAELARKAWKDANAMIKVYENDSGDPFMSTPTGLNLGASAYVPASKPTFAPQPVPRNPAVAFLLSLVLPGLGQYYCRKNSRGTWTLVIFLIAVGVTIWLTPMLGGTAGVGVVTLWWGVLLRVAVFLYVFAFLDAYFTAREMTAGTDPFIAESPRVAAILNLLTRGFGYFYLGQRAAGFAVFLGLGIFLSSKSPAGGLFMEAVLACIAIHAYGIARQREKEILATIEPAPQFAAMGGLPSAVPVCLAVLFIAAYLGLACIGFFLPDYAAINQTPARISPGDKQTVYTNPEYGIEFSAPAGWTLADQDTKYMVIARRNDNVCAANLRLLAWSPILTVGSYIRALSAQLERPENKGSRLVQISPATLGGLPARNIIITIDRQGSALTEHQIVARKGMTLYVLATDSLTESTENCELDFQFIRQRLGLPR